MESHKNTPSLPPKPENNNIIYKKPYRTNFEREGISMFEYIPDILTFKECQDLLKVGKNTLLNLIHQGELDAFKIGNRWKIPKEVVLEFIRNKY